MQYYQNIKIKTKQEITVFFDNFEFKPIKYTILSCKKQIELILQDFELGYLSEYVYLINIDLKNRLRAFKNLTRKNRKKEQIKLANIYGGFRLINKIKTYPSFNFIKNPFQKIIINGEIAKIINFSNKNQEFKIIAQLIN